MGRKGRKGQGTNNPLLLRKLKAQSRPQAKGTTIKDYLSRPRPTLDEIHKIMKERDAKNLQLERWETEMGRDWRATLDENRAQVLKERAEKAKQEKKQVKEARREEKRLAKLKRRLRKGKLTDEEARDYRRSKRQFKKRLGEMQLSQWLNQADDSEDEKRAEAERRREEGGGDEGQDGEEPPLKRPKVAWVFKDNATQTQWKKEKENGHVVQETNPAPVPHADGEAGEEEQGRASGGSGYGGQLPPGMQMPHMPAGMALLQQTSHLQIQMLQQQIAKLQEVLAAQPLLQLEQRVQMQRQIVVLQQQMQMRLQRPPHMPFMLGASPFANPFANAAGTSTAALFARASALSLAMRGPNHPPAPPQAPLSSAAVATTEPVPAPAATNATPAPTPAGATGESQPRVGRAKRVFATTQEASQGTQPPAATQE